MAPVAANSPNEYGSTPRLWTSGERRWVIPVFSAWCLHRANGSAFGSRIVISSRGTPLSSNWFAIWTPWGPPPTINHSNIVYKVSPGRFPNILDRTVGEVWPPPPGVDLGGIRAARTRFEGVGGRATPGGLVRGADADAGPDGFILLNCAVGQTWLGIGEGETGAGFWLAWRKLLQL